MSCLLHTTFLHVSTTGALLPPPPPTLPPTGTHRYVSHPGKFWGTLSIESISASLPSSSWIYISHKTLLQRWRHLVLYSWCYGLRMIGLVGKKSINNDNVVVKNERLRELLVLPNMSRTYLGLCWHQPPAMWKVAMAVCHCCLVSVYCTEQDC